MESDCMTKPKAPKQKHVGGPGMNDALGAAMRGDDLRQEANAHAATGSHPPTSPEAPAADGDAARLEAIIRAAQGYATVLGAAISLMLRSPAHRNIFLSELEWRVLPPRSRPAPVVRE